MPTRARHALLVPFLILTLSAPLAAQETTGRISGAVTDPNGLPVSGAQVLVAGTAFRTPTASDGSFTLRSVPAGVWTVRVEVPSREPEERTVRVWAGQDTRLDWTIGVPTGPAPGLLTQRDPLTSGGALTGAFLESLPIDDPRQGLSLLPGTLARRAALGFLDAALLSIRSAPAGEAAVYVDGAPVRLGLFGTQWLTLGTDMIEEVAVMTGAVGAAVPDAQGGLVSYVVPIGGSRLGARFRAETDEPFGAGSTVGYNRLEGATGGPVPWLRNLTWFAAVNAQGQRSQYRGVGAQRVPTYVWDGLDTTVQTTDASGSVVLTDIPRFVQWSGECGTLGDPASPLGRDIRRNYGFECQGLRRPMDWSTALRVLGKLSFSFGGASSVSLTGLAVGIQQRAFPGSLINAPSLYQGAHLWSRLLVLDAHHRIVPQGSLTLHLNLSRASDRAFVGPLSGSSELETRDPALGIELATLQFTGGGVMPFPLTDRILRDIRTNTGLRVPYLDRGDLRNSQPYRMNPYGLVAGWPSQGFDAQLMMLSEVRTRALVSATWEPLAGHRAAAGADLGWTRLSYYSSGLLRQSFMEAFLAQPRDLGLFAADRIEWGALVLEVGARFDRANVGGLLPVTPLRTFTHPRYGQLYLQAPTDDSAYAAYLADTAIWAPSHAQTAVSPRLRAAYRLGAYATVRVGFARQLERPTYAEWLAGSNSDISFTNTNAPVGRDDLPRRSTVYEVGARGGLGDRVAWDVAWYRKDPVVAYRALIRAFSDPTNPGDTLNALVVAPIDEPSATGLDLSVDWRPFDVLRIVGAYSRASERLGEGIAVSSHAVTAVAVLAAPSAPSGVSLLGMLVRDANATVAVRAVSGAPYTRLGNIGAGGIAPGPTQGFAAGQIELPFQSYLPWGKYLDLRVSRRFRFGGRELTAYLDVRNLFRWRNIEALFAETSDTVNAAHRTLVLDPEFASLWNEAQAAGALVGNDIRLNDCSTWVDRVNCVLLQRVEARFGNGDGLYTAAEQQRALYASYEAVFGAWRLFGPGRTLRVGLEARVW